MNKMIKYLFLNLIVFSAPTFITYPALAVPKTNPDISVNILLLGKKSFGEEDHEKNHGKLENHEEHEEQEYSEHHEKHKKTESHTQHIDPGESHEHNPDGGFSIQEVEIYFKSNIDPYWTGNVSLGLSQHQGFFDLDLEEAFVETLFIPSFTLRAGKFYAFLGKHNNLHTHYYPFIDPPLINQILFGFHGWNSSGVSLAYLSPLPWYSELITQAFYSHKKEKNLSGILFFKNFWELNARSTLELDIAYGTGIKTFDHLYNTSLIYKWKPLDSSKKYSLAWTTEFFQAIEANDNIGGISSYLQWQFLKNWWIQGRADYLTESKWKGIKTQKYSFLLAFASTEYSTVRLQYEAIQRIHGVWEHGLAIQGNMSLGTHPAHLY